MKKLKKGDKVVMHTCGESKLPKYYGKVWNCSSDEWKNQGHTDVIFLDGFSGSFDVKCLQKLDLYEALFNAFEEGRNEGGSAAANDILSRI